MTKAKQCDRCGAVEPKDPTLPDLEADFIAPSLPRELHLCSECQDSLTKWFEVDDEDKSDADNESDDVDIPDTIGIGDYAVTDVEYEEDGIYILRDEEDDLWEYHDEGELLPERVTVDGIRSERCYFSDPVDDEDESNDVDIPDTIGNVGNYNVTGVEYEEDGTYILRDEDDDLWVYNNEEELLYGGITVDELRLNYTLFSDPVDDDETDSKDE